MYYSHRAFVAILYSRYAKLGIHPFVEAYETIKADLTSRDCAFYVPHLVSFHCGKMYIKNYPAK